MIDPIDQKIIDVLIEDSRMSYVAIAKKIKRSESTVRQRISKLIAKGIIEKYSIEIDPAALGYRTVAFIGMNVDPPKLLKVLKALKKIKGLVTIATTTGDYMVLCEVWAEDGVRLTEIAEKIEEVDGVKEVRPSIVLDKYKG